MSSRNSMFDDDNFSQRLLRPWSFASQNDGNPSLSLAMTGKTRSMSEENYTYPRRRRKDLGAWAQYSSSAQRSSKSEEQFAVGKGGWWNQQMLVDRSLRSMATLTTIFAIIMITLCFTHMNEFIHRKNRQSTSVGFLRPRSCVSIENTNLVRYILRVGGVPISCFTCLLWDSGILSLVPSLCYLSLDIYS